MLTCNVTAHRWALIEPFEIASQTMTSISVIVVTLRDAAGNVGRGEAAGVDYDGETCQSMSEQIYQVRHALADPLDPNVLAGLLPPGGARNAIDCAWWDLRAKRTGNSVWQLAGQPPWVPLTTAITIGLGDDEKVATQAHALCRWPVIKLKVDANRHLDRVRTVRQVLPRAKLVVDANQSWSPTLLLDLMPELQALEVALIEQPLPRGMDDALRGISRLVPIAADESCTDRGSLRALVGRYDVATIKLDKCGGLTEALQMIDDASALGLIPMIGNMCGSSLAMAPGFLVGQRCRYVDLDGPMLQLEDQTPSIRCMDGTMFPPESELWG